MKAVVFEDGRRSRIGFVSEPDGLMTIPIREEHPDLELLDNDPMTPILFYGEVGVLKRSLATEALIFLDRSFSPSTKG